MPSLCFLRITRPFPHNTNPQQTQAHTMRLLSSLAVACAATTASAFLLPVRLAPSVPKIGRTALRMSSVDSKDIVDTAVAAGSFKTLATALTVRTWVDPCA